MAVELMKKINICALKEDRKSVLEELQRDGCIEVLEMNEEGLEKMNTAMPISTFERNVASCEKALEILSEHSNEKQSMFAGLEGKKSIEDKEFKKIEYSRTDLISSVNEIIRQGKEIESLRQEIAKCEDEMVAITPWESLDVPMNERGTLGTDLFFGIIAGNYSQEDLEIKLQSMENLPEECEVKVISADKFQTYISVICLKDDRNTVDAALRELEFTRPAYITHHLPKESIRRRVARIEEFNKSISDISEVLEYKNKLKLQIEELSDYYRVRADKYKVLGGLDQSTYTFFVTGSIPEKRVDKLKAKLEKKYSAYVEIEDYGDEEAPVLLTNGKFTGAVEGVVTAFGFPNKLEIDPTAITAFFYYFLFGIMLSDAAYGLIMFVACFVALKKFPNMSQSLAKSLRMFMYCGISTLIWGILFGGYFGDAITVIAKTFFGKNITVPALWFVPLEKPMQMLIYCLIFGIIHLFTGLGIKGYMNLKRKDIYGFVADTLIWYVFLVGLMMMLIPTSMFGSLLGTTVVFPAWANMLAKILTIVGMVGILLTGGRGRKNPVKRLLLGVYSLYDVTGWLSDLLSYSRLLALGLATGVIAQVINTMGAMGGKSVGGVIMFIVVFVIGHVFNMAVNLLGAYVHTNRLQFVEFFGKFYEGGGREFTPFKENTKYVQVENKE